MFKLTLLAEWSFNQKADQKSDDGLFFTMQFPCVILKIAWKYQCLMFKLTVSLMLLKLKVRSKKRLWIVVYHPMAQLNAQNCVKISMFNV